MPSAEYRRTAIARSRFPNVALLRSTMARQAARFQVLYVQAKSGEMEQGFSEEETVSNRKHTKLVHEGKYVAEVDIEIIDSNEGWSPYLSVEDALKLDEVRDALRKGEIQRAERYARVYEISRVHAA